MDLKPWIPIFDLIPPISPLFTRLISWFSPSIFWIQLFQLYTLAINLCGIRSAKPFFTMKFSLVALATLAGVAVADLDPIVIKVLSLYMYRNRGIFGTKTVNRAPNSSIPAMTLSCKYKYAEILLNSVTDKISFMRGVAYQRRSFMPSLQHLS